MDAISALGAMKCLTDAWKLDIVVTGSQKALMMPPGLAFLSASAKAQERIDKAIVHHEEHLVELVEQIRKMDRGVQYYRPMGSSA